MLPLFFFLSLLSSKDRIGRHLGHGPTPLAHLSICPPKCPFLRATYLLSDNVCLRAHTQRHPRAILSLVHIYLFSHTLSSSMAAETIVRKSGGPISTFSGSTRVDSSWPASVDGTPRQKMILFLWIPPFFPDAEKRRDEGASGG